MNQTYGRLVSRAAIAATVMASLLLLIKIFAWWYTGSVSILAALVDSGGHRGVVNQPVGGALFVATGR